jgi:hypothetical protein
VLAMSALPRSLNEPLDLVLALQENPPSKGFGLQ